MIKNGIINAVIVSNEWVGPRCIRKRSSRSMSGSTEAANRSGKFSLTLASLPEPFPAKYPKAKWPIANREKPLSYIADVKSAY
jgi:hypothetical protein